MAKSIYGTLDVSHRNQNIEELLVDLIVERQSKDKLLLQFRDKWVWCYRDSDDPDVEFRFSKDFGVDERIQFICYLKAKITLKIEEADIG